MNEEELLAEIRRRPAEDAPRLLLADWLDERGDPRGQFLRVQCTLAAMSPDDPERPALQACNDEMEQSLRRQIQPSLERAGIRDFRMSRGFIDRMHVTGSQFLDLWRTWTPFAPAVRVLRWSELPARNSADAMQRLMNADFTEALQSLSLYGCRLSLPQVDALVQSVRARQLTTLDLSRTSLGGAAMRGVAASTSLNSLTTLKIAHCDLSPRDAALLARAVAAQRLETLDISSNQIGDEGFESLVVSEGLSNLRMLLASNNAIGVAGIAAFANSSRLDRLTHLVLNENDLGDEAAALLATSSSCGRLQEFRLEKTGITVEGRRLFEQSQWLSKVNSLLVSR